MDAILSAARAMRSTLESLQRVARSPAGQLTAVSVAELLADMERLHRSEFLQRSIDFRISVASDLPRVLCQEQQLRQAVLHCLQFAMEAVETVSAESERLVRLEAVYDSSDVHIMVTHTGPAFEQPGRAFDPPFHPAACRLRRDSRLGAKPLRHHRARQPRSGFRHQSRAPRRRHPARVPGRIESNGPLASLTTMP